MNQFKTEKREQLSCRPCKSPRVICLCQIFDLMAGLPELMLQNINNRVTYQSAPHIF